MPNEINILTTNNVYLEAHATSTGTLFLGINAPHASLGAEIGAAAESALFKLLAKRERERNVAAYDAEMRK